MTKRLILLLSVCALASCTKKVDTRVASYGVGAIEARSFQPAIPDKTASAEILTAYRLVAEKLTSNGMKATENGEMLLEIGLSRRPAHIGMKKPGAILAVPSAKKPSKKCPSREYRLSVALTRISDGAEQYRGYAGEYHCKHQLAEILPLLVDKAMADLKSPRGAYILQRKLP